MYNLDQDRNNNDPIYKAHKDLVRRLVEEILKERIDNPTNKPTEQVETTKTTKTTKVEPDRRLEKVIYEELYKVGGEYFELTRKIRPYIDNLSYNINKQLPIATGNKYIGRYIEPYFIELLISIQLKAKEYDTLVRLRYKIASK